MLVLFETPGGYSLFKLLDEGKLEDPKNLMKEFEAGAGDVVNLQAFQKFTDTTEALAAATALVDGKMDKSLKTFLKKNIVKKNLTDQLAVSDAKLGNMIKDKLNIACVNDSPVQELIRAIRTKFNEIVPGMEDGGMTAMALGLSHSLSRYKLKFSPEKVDVMIIQAINLLDELDKEINTYAMRVREWYGWHFPEMGKIVTDNMQYAKVVLKAGIRKNMADLDFSDILADDVEAEMKRTCEISMGTDISDDDVANLSALCTQVISLSEYRVQLYDYLKNRMAAIAPNLSVMVGDLVGARLIAHAGSLMNLAKAPASTVQILGAEKALFRALKTKHDTPKYGLIYHASLIGQSAPKNKGKISRVLAAKTSLAIRVDALGEESEATIGYSCREKVEARLRQLETGKPYSLESAQKGPAKYDKPKDTAQYSAGADNTMEVDENGSADKKKSKKADDSSDEEEEEVNGTATPDKKKKKEKKEKKEKKKKDKKKKKGSDDEDDEDLVEAVESSAKKSKKRKSKGGDDDDEKKKKKKKKSKSDE
ncbi:Nucleolar protein 58 [Hondaea fermentalgiana]|uniref:Nucleolar protein 58 n=1 Tax=Hondaea fermentalgiana TaxID=2315210 RepID=A0A2R5GWX5_9STRA|nr:Nucleolar protein 58 [Hondaea fermentalgiana]|eukprot:GBG32911.1 Nucleolar protein 58 [Hondaea fermentalgiana]